MQRTELNRKKHYIRRRLKPGLKLVDTIALHLVGVGEVEDNLNERIDSHPLFPKLEYRHY